MRLKILMACFAGLSFSGPGFSVEGDVPQWPQPLHTLVVLHSSPGIPTVIEARTMRGLGEMLESSNAYQVLELEEASQRLSMNPSTLFNHCEDRIKCWQQYAHQLGADLLVLGKISGEGDTHQLRLWLVTSGGILTRSAHRAALPTGGGVPFELVESTFFQPGALFLDLPPGNTRVAVDGGEFQEATGELTRLGELTPGRHKVQAGSADAPIVQVYPVFPGGESQHRIPGPRQPLQQGSSSRWGSVALCAVIVGGVTAVALTRNQAGLATWP